ncbi:MAG: patatin-like phospholipase family protein, partial [Caulobacteraceae bacterium]
MTALTRLFERLLATGEAAAFSLPGGAPLFRKGEDADQLYLLRTGRLGVISRDDGAEPRFLGLIGPGEPVGEMSLIAGLPHAADVVALRDCEILAVPRAAVLADMECDPAVTIELARIIVGRGRHAAGVVAPGEPSVFGFVGVTPQAPVRVLVEAVAEAIRRFGYSVFVAGAEAHGSPTQWFAGVEHGHDFVLYAAEAGDIDWRGLMGRQTDRLFKVAAGDTPPPDPTDPAIGRATHAQPLVDLILVQRPDCAVPQGSATWTAALRPDRLFQLRWTHRGDIERLARVITGQAVGLVLSGGAARAYAHIGAIRALHARQVPIDFVCGVSLGAVIAAGLAMGWNDGELEARIRKAFVESSPVADIAFPLIALTHGRRVRARLAEHFGDRQICDLWLPFFCLSANLTTGVHQIHRQGLAREAIRASLSLPGVLPPVIRGKDILVDGAVMNNFPADIMRSLQPGPIVGVDVGRGRSIDAHDLMDPLSVWRWLLSGAWRRGPPIVSLLMRAATVTTGHDLAAAREATDVLILPMVDNIEIRDWRA